MADDDEKTILDDLFEEPSEEPQEDPKAEDGIEERVKPKPGIKIKPIRMSILKRAYSNDVAMDLLPNNPKEKDVFHIMSGGNINSLSYLIWALRHQQEVEYLLISTWVMAVQDIQILREHTHKIKKLDFYVGEIFEGSYPEAFELLKKVAKEKKGRVCVFRNHSKVIVGTGNNFNFAITSSANVNANPRTENTNIFFDLEICEFYKDFFDSIIPFNKGYESWKPYEIRK